MGNCGASKRDARHCFKSMLSFSLSLVLSPNQHSIIPNESSHLKGGMRGVADFPYEDFEKFKGYNVPAILQAIQVWLTEPLHFLSGS